MSPVPCSTKDMPGGDACQLPRGHKGRHDWEGIGGCAVLKPGCQGCLSPHEWRHDEDCPALPRDKHKPRTKELPSTWKCPECKAVSRWEIQGSLYPKPGRLVEIEMHNCTCSRSDYQQELKACVASGGHDPETVSAGQHSFDHCRKCGHHV